MPFRAIAPYVSMTMSGTAVARPRITAGGGDERRKWICEGGDRHSIQE